MSRLVDGADVGAGLRSFEDISNTNFVIACQPQLSYLQCRLKNVLPV